MTQEVRKEQTVEVEMKRIDLFARSKEIGDKARPKEKKIRRTGN